ncbi:anti-sigma factor [Zafaria sp. Z1313]|uniref:anti-sigma factor n=1 Tax=unclassified Zafaria TaxID=2828765 RepID=UPI002E79D4D3|nr:anti-sigma factor [Zafaria sp. J156]MEE1620334.1 anti-sigma factor [Zafaria sp. J156]
MSQRDARDFSNDAEPEENLGLDLVDEVAQHERRGPSAPVRKWLLLAVAAAVVVIGVTALVLALTPRDLVGEVASAPDRVESSVEVDGGGSAVLAVSRERDAGSLTLEGLPEPEAGQVYHVWVLAASNGAPSSVEALETGEVAGSVGIRGLADISTVTVTVEPASGAEVPGSDPVVSIDVPPAG